MTDGARQVVDEVEGRDVALPLPRQDRPARGLVRGRPQRSVEQAQDRLDVVRGVQRLLQRPRGNPAELLPHRRRRPVELDVGVVLHIGRGPLVGVGLERAPRADERRPRRQGHQLGRGGAPVVEHPLRVLGVAHQRAQVPPSLQIHLVAIDRHDRDVLARPKGRLQHLRARQQVLLDLERHRFPRPPDHADAGGVEHRLVGAEHLLAHRLAVRQGQDQPLDRPPRPVFRRHDAVVVEPRRRQARVAQRIPVHLVGALVASLEPLAVHGIDHEGQAPVAAVRCGRIGIGEDRERIGHPLDDDVLVEPVVARIAGVDAEVAEPAGHRAIQRRVIGRVGVRDVLDVADQAVDDLRHGRIRRVVGRVHLDRRPVLAGVVDHLADEGRQAVDGQARPGVQLAALPHLGRPLLAQTREADVVERRRPVLRLVRHAQLEGLLRLFQKVVHVASAG